MSGSFNVTAYHDRLRAALRPLRFTEHILGSAGEHPLSAWTRPALDPESKEPITPKAHIYLSSGVHGDEPAGPLALSRLLQQFVFSTDITWHLLPLVNPTGMEAGTRENAQGVDVNRDFRSLETLEAQAVHGFLKDHQPDGGYDLVLCLHEDYEAEGCYIYQLDSTEGSVAMGQRILESTSEYIATESASEIDGHIARAGLITPLQDRPIEMAEMEALPEAVYLFQVCTPRCYTLETPSSAYIEHRVAAQAAGVRAAVAEVIKEVRT